MLRDGNWINFSFPFFLVHASFAFKAHTNKYFNNINDTLYPTQHKKSYILVIKLDGFVLSKKNVNEKFSGLEILLKA